MAAMSRAYHRAYYRKNRKRILLSSRLKYAADSSLRNRKSRYRKSWWDRLKRDLNSKAWKTQVLRRARYRARELRVPFNLSVGDFSVPKICPILGLRIRVARGRHDDRSPALDRIIPRKGYVRGNVMVISQRANVLKRDASLEELEKLVRGLRRLTPSGRVQLQGKHLSVCPQ
jgi:hypothetical protein